MYKKTCLLFFILLFLVSTSSFAQRFKAGAIAGVTLSQMDGDQHTGFDKFGIQAGLKGIAIITERIHVNTELLFSQKGSFFPSRLGVEKKDYTIGLNYMEVPILVDVLVKQIDKDHYRHHLSGGISYSRLFNANFEEPSNSPISFKRFEEEFNKNELSLVLGYGNYITRNIGLDFRYTYAFSQVFEREGQIESSDTNQTEFLRNYHMSLRLFYVF